MNKINSLVSKYTTDSTNEQSKFPDIPGKQDLFYRP
jgi:hypothetical protein